MNTSKIIKGAVSNGRYTVTAPIVKEDYGLYLQIEGVELPSTYEVDFSNSENSGSSVTMIGNADGVLIPRQFIDSGKDVFAFLYHVGADYGRTVYKFRIPNKVRPDRTNEEPTPEEQSVIDQAIGALNDAVAQTAQDVESTDQSARSASDDADRAERAKTGAETAQSKAEKAQKSAERAKDDAETSERNASESERKAKGYAETASEKANAITGLTATAQTLPEGSSATANYNAETGVMSFGIPKGKDGTDGTDGIDGISPSVTVTDITGGHRVVITDESGSKTFDVMDGATGATPNLTIGTVETLEPTESATATITGTPENPILNLGIPQGEQGEVTLADLNTALMDKADIITDTASGSIASFPDGADDLPLKSLVVNIDPVQDLSNGDPSPENICPISGWTGANVVGSGRNLIETVGTGRTTGNVEFTVNSDGSVTAVGLANATAWWKGTTTITGWRYIKAGTYKLSGGKSNNKMLYLIGQYVDGTKISNATVTGGTYDKGSGLTFTLTKDAYINYQIQIANGENANDTFYPMIRNADDTDTTWEPYRGISLPISWQSEAGTVYGGKLDVLSGELTIDRAMIASYNGETLPSTWISDRDAYTQGATPTTGAQVVYELATPLTIQLSPNQLNSLYGVNNIWADSGDTEVVYRADTKLYIAKKIAEAISALS